MGSCSAPNAPACPSRHNKLKQPSERYKPVVEMMQIKGESECRNGMFGVIEVRMSCAISRRFEFWATRVSDCGEDQGKGAQAGKGCTSRNDYVRYALVDGLRRKRRLGVNPYQFGFIGVLTHIRRRPAR